MGHPRPLSVYFGSSINTASYFTNTAMFKMFNLGLGFKLKTS